MSENKERYAELSEDITQHFMEIYNKKSFPINVGFTFIEDNKLKKVVKAQKISDLHKFIMKKDILVTVNESLYDLMDDESLDILFHQELDKISVNGMNGKITMLKPDLVTFSPLMKKYGTDAVLRANQVEDLASEQNDDLESDFK